MSRMEISPFSFLLSHLLNACLNSFSLRFVTRLAEEGKHVALVVFYTGLVERIHTEHETADAATDFEEVDELTDVVSIQL